MKLSGIAGLLIVLLGLSVSAETILPVGYSSDSEFTGVEGARTIEPGVTVGLFNLSADTVDTMRHSGSGWVSQGNDFVGRYIQYDLGGQYNLSALKIYNGALAGQYNRGVQQLDIQVSNDGTSWNTAVADQVIAQTTTNAVAQWQTVNFTANDYRYVRLMIDTNYGSAYAEIAKVQFEGTAAQDQSIITPTSATNTMGELAGFELAGTYDQVGVNTPSDLMNSTVNDAGTYNWVSSLSNTTGEIVWSFDAAQDLQSMLVWNGNDGANFDRGVNQFDLLVSPDVAGDNWIPVVTDDTLAFTSASGNWYGPEAVGIRYAGVRRVKMVVDSNHGAANYTMLNEVAFVGYTHRQTILPVDYSSNNEFSAGWGLRTITPSGSLNAGLVGLNTETVDSRQHAGSGWVTGPAAVNPYIQYDLGGQYNLTALKIYNGALASDYNRGVKTLDVQVSNDGSSWTDAAMNQTIAKTTGAGVEWQTVNFTANDYRYVRLTAVTNYGSAYTEIAKVQFEGSAAQNQSILIPVGASTTMGQLTTYSITNTFDFSGIRTPSDLMNSSCEDNGVLSWVSASGNTNGEIIWAFADAQDLQSMLVWNGSDDFNANRGIQQYDLLVSPDASGDNWIPVVTDDKLTQATDSNIWLGPEAVAIRHSSVRRVKMVVDSNYGNATYTMLNEVAFVGYTHRQTILPVDYSSNNEFSLGVGARTIVPGLYGASAQTPNTVTGLRQTGSGWVTGANAVNPYIQYDLGGQYNLTALKIYNGALSGQYNRGVQQLDVQVSNDGSTWTDAAMNQTIAQTTGTGVEWQTVNFTANDYRYVRLTVDSNYGNTYTEIAKVQFEGTPASAQAVVSPASASTTMGEFNASAWPLANTYNYSGIRTSGDLMNSTADDASGYNWFSDGTLTGEVVWAFAQAQDLESMLVWNVNDGGAGYNRGVNQYDLLVSTNSTGEDWVAVVTDGKLEYTSGSGVWCGPQTVGIEQADVRRVKMVVDSNHGGTLTGLSEVKFVSTVLPEPTGPTEIDGIPITWIESYFGTTNGFSAGQVGTNGFTYGESYAADLNPTNVNSVLAVSSASSSGSNVTVTYQNGGSGANVYVEYRTSLTTGLWVPIATNMAPVSTSNIYEHANSDAQGFYRLTAERP